MKTHATRFLSFQPISIYHLIIFFVAASISTTTINNATAQDSIGDAITAIRAVEVGGKNQESAAKAMKVLNAASPDKIPAILDGMGGANQLALNWFKGAVESIIRNGDDLPRDQIKSYFEDKSKGAMGRLLAYELLTKDNPSLADKIIPTLTDDPSMPLRAIGIASEIEKAKSAEPADAVRILAVAFTQVRDVQQVETIADMLAEHGMMVNTQKQLGFINRWHIVGCFDNKDEKGFSVAHGPEKDPSSIDVEKNTFKDAEGNEVKWAVAETAERSGVINIVDVLGPIKGVTAYAVANFTATDDMEVDIRFGSSNAHKVWVNGELSVTNEIYHNGGTSTDKFSGRAKLKKGKNQILLKICQNEQTQSWAQSWDYQLRICDQDGLAIQPAAPPKANY